MDVAVIETEYQHRAIGINGDEVVVRIRIGRRWKRARESANECSRVVIDSAVRLADAHSRAIEDPAVARKILDSLGLPSRPPPVAPARRNLQPNLNEF